jgi:hypothetical protein
MHRLTHRRSRSAAVDDDSSLATTRSGVKEADTVDSESTSTPLQTVNMPDEIEVSGGNKTYRNSSRSQPKQRSLAASTRSLTVRKNGSGSASMRGSNRTKIHRFEPVRSSRRAMKSSDDSRSSESDSDSSILSVEDEEDEENEDATDISDSTSTSDDLDDVGDSQGESHDSLDDEEDQSAEDADEDRQDTPVVKKATTNTRLVPVRSFSAVPGLDRQRRTIQPDTRRLTSTSKLQRASGREVIYVRVPHSTSADAQRRLNRQLRNEYPGTLIVLDDSPTKMPFVDRTSFSLLWQRIQDGRVDCIWLPRASHISKSKEAFEMFEWMCDEHRVPILILPTLEAAIKTARTNI